MLLIVYVCCWLCMCEADNLKVLIKYAQMGDQRCYEFVSQIWKEGKKAARAQGGYHYQYAGYASAHAKLWVECKLRVGRGQLQLMENAKRAAIAKYKGHNITMLKDKLYRMEKSNQLMIKSIELLVVFSLFAFDYL